MADYQMGGYIEGETDEEYRRRMAALNTPVKQTIVTNPDGSQEVTVKGTKEALSSANPNTPTLMQPGEPYTGQGLRMPPSMQPVAPTPVAPPPPPPQVMAQPAPQPAPVAPQPQMAQAGRYGSEMGQEIPVAQTSALAEPQGIEHVFTKELSGAGGDAYKLMTLGRDTRFTPEQQARANQEAQTIMAREVQQRRTEQAVRDQYTRAMETGNFSPLAKMLRSRDDEGSYAKMVLMSFISPELAGREAAKLGLKDQTVTADVNGEPVILKMRDGKPVEGYSGKTGQALDAQQLVAAAAGVTALKGTTVHTGKMQDMTTGEIYYEKTTPTGIQLVDHTGKRYAGSSNNLRAYGIGSDIATKNQIQINELTNKLAYAPANKRAEIVAENEARHGQLDPVVKQRALEGQPMAAVVGAVPTQPPAQATAKPVQQAAPAQVQQAAPAQVQQAAPAQVQQAAPAQVQAAPVQTQRTAVAPTAVAPTAVATAPAGGAQVTGGGNTIAGRETNEALRKEAGKSNIEVSASQIKDRNKANQDYSDSLAASRQTAAAQGSTITRLQSAIDRNPNFWGIDTNSPAWRAFVDVNSTNPQKAESLDTLARNMNIPKEQRSAFDAVMNDYRNLQINAITGSGLTASQTNTERESQRVMGTIGSISDRPAAAKATLEYARAKIEYTDAKAKAWAQARKTNPGIDRLDFETNFDAREGEKIFKDANERMRNILGGPEAAMDVRRQADRILGAP